LIYKIKQIQLILLILSKKSIEIIRTRINDFDVYVKILRQVKALFVFVCETFYEAVVRKTVIGVIPDDDVIKDLDHQEFCGPDKIPCEPFVLGRGRGVARGMVMNEYKTCGLVFKCKAHNLAWINSTSSEGSEVHFFDLKTGP